MPFFKDNSLLLTLFYIGDLFPNLEMCQPEHNSFLPLWSCPFRVEKAPRHHSKAVGLSYLCAQLSWLS